MNSIIDGWKKIPYVYNRGEPAEYAYKLGVLAAKKCLKRYSDAQILKLIKKARKDGMYETETIMVAYHMTGRDFDHTLEFREAVNKFDDYVARTVFDFIGKTNLKKYYGNDLTDNQLKWTAAADALKGWGVFRPLTNIQEGFAYYLAKRMKDIGNKMKHEQEHAKKTTAKARVSRIREAKSTKKTTRR